MKNRTMTTNIGTINLAEMELMTDCMEVFIPITAVSDSLKATIEENIQKAKDEWQKECLDERGMQWSDAGVNLVYQSLHIIMKTDNRKLMEYSIKSFTDNDYKIEDICLNLYEENIKDNIPTEYEKKFVSKGCPIYKIEVKKD